MERVTLGGSAVEVSRICLGTMTFGNQTDEAGGHQQMDMALEAGMTFLDCAEMYPVNPVRRETIGVSEEIIGRWLARTGNRDRVEIATKITGPSQMVRDGAPFDGATVRACIDASLRRLQTDRIDLYQLHWPVRGSYGFRQNWGFDPSGQDKAQTLAHMRDVLEALKEAVAAGKLRAVGLSNESAWGLTRWCDVADAMDAPRMAAIQNEYSPLYRLYDTDLAEAAVNEDVTLLSYSPLAAGGRAARGQPPGGGQGHRRAGQPGRAQDRARAEGCGRLWRAGGRAWLGRDPHGHRLAADAAVQGGADHWRHDDRPAAPPDRGPGPRPARRAASRDRASAPRPSAALLM